MRKWIVGCVLVCSLCLSVVLCCENGRGRIEGRMKTDTVRVTVVDTATYRQPVARDSVVVRYVTRLTPIVRDTVHCTRTDTVRIRLPVTQRRYEDSTYTAWVSGYDVQLDSIYVYPKHEYVTRKIKQPPKKWHIGVTAGYGFGKQGMQPYIGIGLTYSLISF